MMYHFWLMWSVLTSTFRLLHPRWMDRTIPPSPPVCDRRPIGPPSRGDEVVSACQVEAFYGHCVARAVWTPNLLLRLWNVVVGKLSFLFCPGQKDKINSCSPHLAACGLLSGRSLSPQTICGFGNGFWIMPYTNISYSAVSSNIPKYEVSCRAWQFAQTFSTLWSYGTPSPMSQNIVRLFKCWSKMTSGFPQRLILYRTMLYRSKDWAGNSHPVRCNNNLLRSQSGNPRGESFSILAKLGII